jgi:hypothetical protein
MRLHGSTTTQQNRTRKMFRHVALYLELLNKYQGDFFESNKTDHRVSTATKKQIQPGSFTSEPRTHKKAPHGLHSSQKRVGVDKMDEKASTQEEKCITPILVDDVQR